ncbi:hypothetical protein ACHAQJ_003958 [Trichoderma viride]
MVEPTMAPKILKSTYTSKPEEDDLEDDRLHNRKNRHGRDDVTSLAEFLKNHEPPSNNFMSVPFAYEDDKERESKWSKFMTMKRRSKSVPRAPVNIQLPDSAVSGVTSGGHRHIAISIPLDAMPFAADSNSQNPLDAKNNTGVKLGGAKSEYATLPRSFAVQTYSGGNGTVTVFPTATDEVDGLSRAPPAQRSSVLSQQSISSSVGERSSHTRSSHRRSNSQSTGYSTEASTVVSNKSKQPVYFSIFPKTTDTRQGLPPTPTRPNNQQRSAKASSMMIAASQKQHRPAHSASIDGLLSLMKNEDNVRDGYNTKPLPSPPPPKSEARTKPLYRPSVGFPSPITEESTDGSTGSSKRAVRRVVSAQTMLSVNKETPSRPSTAGSIQTRREKVRDKKRRDMEAVRHAKVLKEQQQRRHSEDTQKGHDGAAQRLQDEAGHDTDVQDKGKGPQASSINTLCPIIVVVDLQPSPGLPDETSASLPSPVPSSSTSQMRLSRDMDSELYLENKRNMMDKQILRLYESYHENRLRDVERRIRRLERNGDVWLRALVPVLDDMSRNIKTIHPSTHAKGGADAEGRGWASDDEVSSGAGAERKTRSAKRTKASTRRASLSRDRIVAGLTGGEKPTSDDGEGSDTMSRSDDVSGLGIIEPLMRELAGEARRRQQQIAERTADDWRHNTV